MPSTLQCHLATSDEAAARDHRASTELVERLRDSSHGGRFVVRCKECGQLYLVDYEEFETWNGASFDGSYSTFLPVGSLDRAREIASVAGRGLIDHEPRLMIDAIAGQPATARWVRGAAAAGGDDGTGLP